MNLFIVDTEDTLIWQPKLLDLAARRIKINKNGLKLLSKRETFEKLNKKLSLFSSGITFLGSGEFHHLSYHLIRVHAKKSLTLIVFDRHADCSPAIQGFISCGSWLAEVAKLPAVSRIVLIGTDEPISLSKVTTVPPAQWRAILKRGWHSFKILIPTKRIYISIDKDVLREVNTSWGNGPIALNELLAWLRWARCTWKIVGVDVCGELVPRNLWPNHNEIRWIKTNERVNLAIYRTLSKNVNPAQNNSA